MLIAMHRDLKGLSADEKEAWYRVLKPYSYDECMEALEEFTRRSEKPPKPRDVANLIPDSSGSSSKDSVRRETVPPPEETSPTLWRDYVRHVRAFREAGIPTAIEAKHSGITYDEWCRMANEAGL